LVSDIRNTMGVSPLAQPYAQAANLGPLTAPKTYQDSRHVTSDWRWVVQIDPSASRLRNGLAPVADSGHDLFREETDDPPVANRRN
jgi:hypothetical protein